MKTMSIEEMKTDFLRDLEELLADIDTLRENAMIARADLGKVNTEEDAKVFDATHDLEDGLKHIQLF